MQAVEALIVVMVVTWLAAATLLVLLWRQVRETERMIAQQRLLLELRVMRARFRHHAPDVDPGILGREDRGVEAGSPEAEADVTDGTADEILGSGSHAFVADLLGDGDDGEATGGDEAGGDGHRDVDR